MRFLDHANARPMIAKENKFSFIFFAFAFLSVFLCLKSHDAHAWGMKAELKNERVLHSSLITKAMRNNSISYCLTIEPKPSASLENEVSFEFEFALKLWLNALSSIDNHTTLISKKSCDEKVDIVVNLSKKLSGDTSNGAFASTTFKENLEDDYTLIKIDTDYVWKETRNIAGSPNGLYRWQTIRQAAFHQQDDLSYLLKKISILTPKNVDELAQESSRSAVAIYWTTYRAFIHELGHGFGLCDTVSDLINSQCDTQIRSPNAQPESVMKTSNFFYLTQDDLDGLYAIHKYINELKK